MAAVRDNAEARLSTGLAHLAMLVLRTFAPSVFSRSGSNEPKRGWWGLQRSITTWRQGRERPLPAIRHPEWR